MRKLVHKRITHGVLMILCLGTQFGMADTGHSRLAEAEARWVDRRHGKNSQPGSSSIDDSSLATVQGGWFDKYMSRETISDPKNLPAPSKASMDSWAKEFLELPYPPRYTKTRQTKDDRDVWAVLNGRYNQLRYFCPILATAYIEYNRYNLDVAKVNAVCKEMRAATQVKAWKDYWERTTRVRIRANDELKNTIAAIGTDVDNLFKPLVDIKKNEYAAWASKHPQAATNISLKRRVEEAERRAQAAEERANAAATTTYNSGQEFQIRVMHDAMINAGLWL